MRTPSEYHLRRELRSLAYLQHWGETVKKMEESGDMSPATARRVFKLLRVVARGLCEPEPVKKRREEGGRGRKRRRRQALVAAFSLGAAGGLVITHTISELLFGRSGGEEFLKYKSLSEKREAALRNDIGRLAEKIKELQRLEAATLIIAQIQLMADEHQEEWLELNKNTVKTRGDVVLKRLLKPTIDEYKKKNLLNVTSGPFDLDGPFQLDPAVYKVEVQGLERARCSEARLGLNLISAVPSSKCYRILNETTEYTLLDNEGGGCLIAPPRNATTTLIDGSLFSTAAVWDSKKKTCSSTYLDNYNIGFSNGLVLLGGKENTNGSYFCGRRFGIKDVRVPGRAGTSLFFPCRGQLGEGSSSVNFYSVDVKVVDDQGETEVKLDGTEEKGFYINENYFSSPTLETADYCGWNDCAGETEKAAVGSTVAILGGGAIAAVAVLLTIWRKKKETTSFYRRGSSYENKDELKRVTEMTNSLAKIGENMKGMVLALDRLGPGSDGYDAEEEGGEHSEEHTGKTEQDG